MKEEERKRKEEKDEDAKGTSASATDDTSGKYIIINKRWFRILRTEKGRQQLRFRKDINELEKEKESKIKKKKKEKPERVKGSKQNYCSGRFVHRK